MITHPKKDDSGNPVRISEPSQPSDSKAWNDPKQHASTVPGHKDVPSEINGVKVKSHPTPKTWKNVEGQGDFKEPTLPQKMQNMRMSAGVVMVEKDPTSGEHKVWVTHPTNKFGGYSATFPKGGVEHGLNTRENAIKETHEETGLKAELHDHLGDFQKTTSVNRMYIGKRTGGHPSDMGWESQKVSLVPLHDLHKVVTHPADQPIIDALRNKLKK